MWESTCNKSSCAHPIANSRILYEEQQTNLQVDS